MERWMKPLSFRWTVVLGAGLLALSLGLASYRIRAVEPEKPASVAAKEKEANKEAPKKALARSKREALRYGGKNFDQWRTEMETELKPAIRVDGMKAFAAFGANGYGPEATQAILEMMRGYDVVDRTNPDDFNVVQEGYRAIRKIGEAAVPALTQAVEGKNRNARRFAIEALDSMKTDARSAVPILLKAMKNDDVVTRALAREAVRTIDAHAKGFIPALIEALKDEDAGIRSQAAARLREVNIVRNAKPAIPALLEALRDKESDVRWQAIQTVKAVGVGKEAVAAVSRLLQEEDYNTQRCACEILQSLGLDAKEAVPALIAAVKEKKKVNLAQRLHAVVTLGDIGPAAKDAVPTLTELLRSDEPALSNEANQALKKISPR